MFEYEFMINFYFILADRLPSVAFQLEKNPWKNREIFFFAKSKFFSPNHILIERRLRIQSFIKIGPAVLEE